MIKNLKRIIRQYYDRKAWVRLLLFIPVTFYSKMISLFKRDILGYFYSYLYYNTGKIYKMNEIRYSNIKDLGIKKTRLPHPIGIVIGKNVQIGVNCTIYQNVTIGAKSNEDSTEGKYPRIGNNVIIGASAVIIGDITIGDNVIIGANALVSKKVQDNSIIVGNNLRIEKASK